MGSPHTYDVCDFCGEAIVNLNNAGTLTHVETDAVKNGIPATDCKNPMVRNKALSRAGESIANHGRAKKITSGRRDDR